MPETRTSRGRAPSRRASSPPGSVRLRLCVRTKSIASIVSNTPAYPKKLPIVLIATLATLLLSSGAILTGELLRLTAPRAAAAFVPPSASIHASPAIISGDGEPVAGEAPEIVTELDELERLAEALRGADAGARKVTVLGTASSEGITLTTQTLARLMAREARVVVVDLAASSPISGTSIDPHAPGLAELMQGEASFSQIITRDRLSRVHLVSAGRPGSDRGLLQSARLVLAIDALLRAYDHVVLDAGAASDLPAELLTANACAVVVPDPSMEQDSRTRMCEQLKAVGFSEVVMLSGAVQPSRGAEIGPSVAAA